MFRRLFAPILGCITSIITTVGLMLILWPTINTQAIIDVNTKLVNEHGFLGHLWVILLMLLVVNIFIPFNFKIPTPIAFMKDYNLQNSFGNAGMYFLILFIWFVGAFAGGMVTRRGLRSGSSASVMAFLLLDFLFATITASILSGYGGMTGFALFIATFFFAIILGSFVFVGIIGFIGGSIGGILGKLLLRPERGDTNDKE